MRLWHISLIPHLPRQQLLGQHRECCALRGLGWGRKHSTVNYVFKYPYEMLFNYHLKVMKEMTRRNYYPDAKWYDFIYRGKRVQAIKYNPKKELYKNYPEHNKAYLNECLDNLRNKGIIINNNVF